MTALTHKVATLLLTLLLLPLLFTACNNKEQPETTITIGYARYMPPLLDSTYDWESSVLDDLVNYYNTQHLIPGVHLESASYVLSSDNFDTYGKENADLIYVKSCDLTHAIRPIAEEKKLVMFTRQASGEEALQAPGYEFCINSLPQYEAYTFLNWLAEQDPGFPVNRPARIGGVHYNSSSTTSLYSVSFFNGSIAYASANPDKYVWAGEYQVSCAAANFDAQVSTLKDCDYVIAPSIEFIKAYRNAGGRARFIGLEWPLDSMSDMRAYMNLVDGLLTIRASEWWTDTSLMNVTSEVLKLNCSSGDCFWKTTIDYINVNEMCIMLEVIAQAVEDNGPQGVDSDAIYQAAQSFSQTSDGIERYSFNETKRTGANYYGIYEYNSSVNDLIRVDPVWYPVIYTP